MTEISRNIKEQFFKVWVDKNYLLEFEKWVYESTELQDNLNPDSYFDFLSFNYKTENAHSDLLCIIKKQLTQSEFEKWKLIDNLFRVKNRTGNYTQSIRDFYTMCSRGYRFLDSLAYSFALKLEYPYLYSNVKTFDELTDFQKQTLVDNLYPDILDEINKVLNWIENEEIILLGKTNEFEMLDYIDNRTDFDKNVFKENESYKKSKWWEFWK